MNRGFSLNLYFKFISQRHQGEAAMNVQIITAKGAKEKPQGTQRNTLIKNGIED
jgi:hypothetical protein